MNRFNKYNTNNISFEDIDNMIDQYLKQVNNDYIKKVAININGSDIEINIEPYYEKSTKWEYLIKLLKEKKVNFWFRDDDAGVDTVALEKLVKYMEELNINLLIGAIPEKTDNILATILKKYPNIYVAQHGYSHKNYSKTEQSEYPEDRNQQDINQEIIKGRKKLQEEFKEQYIDIFIPPWFEINKETIKTIKNENYIAMSNYWNNHINEFNLIEINCQIDLINWDKAYTFGGEDFVINQIINELEKKDHTINIGILLHHERMGKESYYFLDKLIKVIKENAKIIDIKDVIKLIGEKHD